MATETGPSHFDVIVLGVGSMGSAACWFLARRGKSVLGLEQFEPPHDMGSHAGQSRIIRKAYFEHPDYVPLLARAYENWQSLEAATGASLYYQTGIVYCGRPDNANIAGIRNSARLHDIPIENVSREQGRTRFPLFRLPQDFDVIFEPDAGFVAPERTIDLYTREAVRLGAVVKTRTSVRSWYASAGRIHVATSAGEYTADKIIITAGAWASRHISPLHTSLQVTRQVLAWVDPPDRASYSLGNFPCWFVEDPPLGTFYGFPLLAGKDFTGPVGIKLAHHHPGATCRPEDILQDVPNSEAEKLIAFLRTYLPSAGDKIAALKNCLYTYSADAHFIIDQLPAYDGRVIVACGFSGHGFKFVPVVGEILADLAVSGETDLPISFLRLARF